MNLPDFLARTWRSLLGGTFDDAEEAEAWARKHPGRCCVVTSRLATELALAAEAEAARIRAAGVNPTEAP